MKLVYSLISKEYPTYIHDEDIIQCGMLGLCLAAERWDESRGTKFSSFAFPCIRNAIIDEFKRRSKHQGVLSLDYEVGTPDDKTPLGDLIVGDEDVLYVDDCENQLTPLQKKIVVALRSGMTPRAVAEAMETPLQNVYFTQRKIRILRGRSDGD
jgi:RNA polymerase sigma factor (sigma-70 family)